MRDRNDSRGARIQCINFEMCPVCYKCRNYNHLDNQCMKCEKDPKANLCDKKLHKEGPMAKLVTKQIIKLD